MVNCFFYNCSTKSFRSHHLFCFLFFLLFSSLFCSVLSPIFPTCLMSQVPSPKM